MSGEKCPHPECNETKPHTHVHVSEVMKRLKKLEEKMEAISDFIAETDCTVEYVPYWMDGCQCPRCWAIKVLRS